MSMTTVLKDVIKLKIVRPQYPVNTSAKRGRPTRRDSQLVVQRLLREIGRICRFFPKKFGGCFFRAHVY